MGELDELPEDANALRTIVVDLAEQLDRAFAEQHKYQSLLRELLEAQRNRKSERLSKEQLALFGAAWQARKAEAEFEETIATTNGRAARRRAVHSEKRSGRQALARHLVRERIVHDLAESEKHGSGCGPDLRLITEETSERYDYIRADLGTDRPFVASDNERVAGIRLIVFPHPERRRCNTRGRRRRWGGRFGARRSGHRRARRPPAPAPRSSR